MLNINAHDKYKKTHTESSEKKRIIIEIIQICMYHTLFTSAKENTCINIMYYGYDETHTENVG